MMYCIGDMAARCQSTHSRHLTQRGEKKSCTSQGSVKLNWGVICTFGVLRVSVNTQLSLDTQRREKKSCVSQGSVKVELGCDPHFWSAKGVSQHTAVT